MSNKEGTKSGSVTFDEYLAMASKQELERFFREADVNENGTLSYGELQNMLKKRGYAFSKTELRRVFKMADLDGDHKIDFEEYITAMVSTPGAVHRTAAWRRAFLAVDPNRNGYITNEDLRKLFEILGERRNSFEVNKIMEMFDRNKDGKLDYEEFLSGISEKL